MSDARPHAAGEQRTKLSRGDAAKAACDFIHAVASGEVDRVSTALVERNAAIVLNSMERSPRARPRGRRGNRNYRNNHLDSSSDAHSAARDTSAAGELRAHGELQRGLLGASKQLAEERDKTIEEKLLREEVSALCCELERLQPGSSGKVLAGIAERRAASSAAPVAEQQRAVVGPNGTMMTTTADRRDKTRETREERERRPAPRVVASANGAT
jgi:hypothetical protein